MITEIEDYFRLGCGRCARFGTPDCATAIWADGLRVLRAVCLGVGVEETVKWGHPCYVHAGRNIAIIGAFRDDFRLSFFEAALLTDPDRVLEKQGSNTRHPDMIRFRSAADVTARRGTIGAYLAEAIGYAEAGKRAPRDRAMPAMPPELEAALATDPELDSAFGALTPGRQKSYLINLNGAKTAETRMRRIAKFRDRILAGKGAQER